MKKNVRRLIFTTKTKTVREFLNIGLIYRQKGSDTLFDKLNLIKFIGKCAYRGGAHRPVLF